MCPLTPQHSPFTVIPRQGSYNSRVNSRVDGCGIRGTDAHPAKGRAQSIRLHIQMIRRVMLGPTMPDLHPILLLFIFLIVVIVIAFDRDARPFAVYRFNVRTRARKLVRVEREKGSELAQSAEAVAVATARVHGMLPLGTGRRRWWRIEKREDIHETCGMRDARELARHILRAELVRSDQVSYDSRLDKWVKEETMKGTLSG